MASETEIQLIVTLLSPATAVTSEGADGGRRGEAGVAETSVDRSLSPLSFTAVIT